MGKVSEDSPTTPICRCRVMYLGSAVPHITKDGLQGIQEPLRDLYPEQGLTNGISSGIDSWLSVWSNGILVENVDDQGNELKRFHPIESLHYCAAVRFVSVPRGVQPNANHSNSSAINGNSVLNNNTSTIGEKVAKFLPLDSPFSRYANTSHPPLFACILRRTTGIKVLECHAFICKKEAAANALVRCCFHAYADTIHAKQIDSESPYEQLDRRRSRSISALDTVEKVEEWRNRSNTDSSSHEDIVDSVQPTNGSLINGHSMSNGHGSRPRTPSATSIISHSHDEENYKVWNGSAPLEREVVYLDGSATLRSMRSNANSMLSKPPKPRQIAIPCSAPPPPLPPSLPPSLPPPKTLMNHKKSKKKESTLKKKHKYKGFLGPQQITAPHMLANGYAMNVMTPSHHIHPQPPPHAIYATSTIYSDGRRLMSNRRPPAPPPPPPMQQMSHGYIPDGYSQHPIMLGPNEESIYIPAMRPITPMSNFPMQAIHTDQGMIVHNGQHYFTHEPPFSTTQRSMSHREGIDERDKNKRKDRKKWSQGEVESPFNTGIYKKKGHLNERAFSYSIRQEHRSRSNSLTNLQFDEHNGESLLSANGDSMPLIDDNYHLIHNRTNGSQRNGSLTERELSERLTALKMNGEGQPPAPPPPPINGLLDQPKVATIKRRLNSKH